MMDEIVGRDAELAQLRELLARGRSALVVLRGELGVGKTALLRAACADSPEWSIVPGHGLPGVYVEPRDTPESVTRKLAGLLELASGDEPAEIDGVVAALRTRAPMMLVFERYRPSAQLDAWVAERLQDLQCEGPPVVVVVTDPPPLPARVTRDAAIDMTLGPLDEAAVRAHMAPFAAAARPPVEGAELDRYVESISGEPGLLRPLERVLAAAAEAAA